MTIVEHDLATNISPHPNPLPQGARGNLLIIRRTTPERKNMSFEYIINQDEKIKKLTQEEKEQ